MDDYTSFIFEKRKNNLLKISNGKINQEIIYYINEARTSPNDFSRDLMINDDVDESVKSLSLFFKYDSQISQPLIFDKNIQNCCNKLLNKIISKDNGAPFIKLSPYEKESYNLKIRLNNIGLTPTYFKELIIIGVDDAMEALVSLFLNPKHRNSLLSPKIKYIGVSSCLLPSERICIIIGLVESLIIIDEIEDENYDYYYDENDFNRNSYENNKTFQPENYNNIRLVNGYYQLYNQNNNNNHYYNDFHWCNKNNQTFYNDRVKHYYPKKEVIFCNRKKYCREFRGNEEENIKQKRKNKFVDFNLSKECSMSPIRNSYMKNSRFTDFSSGSFMIYPRPVSVSFGKKYVRDNFGKIFPVYTKETLYDDGSLLIQNPDEL